MSFSLSSLALLIFPVLMAFAAISDLLTMRISNRLVYTVLLGFAVVAIVAQLPLETIGMHLACAAAALAVTFSFFAFGWIGGGDAKLVAATALWLGFSMMLQYIVFASLLGGALTLIILGFRRWPLSPRLRNVVWLDRLHDEKTGVPYGIALAAAALLIYPDTLVFQQLIG
ncbi:A24 family peptidase [Devosia sp.]|uniref:A24 family peptidase n=1 Tax=Devosia sp. TaxID=1871048 RepID=UPI003A8FFD57